MNPNCWNNDHDWLGSGACIHCGVRLRCVLCGRFVTESGIDKHMVECAVLAALPLSDPEPDKQ